MEAQQPASLPRLNELAPDLEAASTQGATPEGWRPGQKVIVPPPVTAAEAEKWVQDKRLEVTD